MQYLMKYSDAGKNQLEMYQNSPPGAAFLPPAAEMLVKRPGDRAWVPLGAPEAADIMRPADPTGGHDFRPDPVNP